MNNYVNAGAPVLYQYQNVYNSARQPSTMHATDTGLSRYFQRYLLQRAMSVFKWEMPKTWSKNYFLYTLYCWGFITVINTDKYGVIPQACSLQGYNIFYEPTNVLVSNPLFKGTKTATIGENCTLIKLQPDYGGIMDIVTFYADMLALCAQTAATNLVNSKLSYVFTAENKSAAESFKKLFDKVASGEPAVVIDKNLTRDDGTPAWETFQQNLRENYIAGDILQDMRQWVNQFDTEIGIPNANIEKRERLITDEVNANNFETKSKCALWLEELQKACELTREMFNINLNVDWREMESEAV